MLVPEELYAAKRRVVVIDGLLEKLNSKANGMAEGSVEEAGEEVAGCGKHLVSRTDHAPTL